jgi:ABC-type polar amino acid transport system ATPase subunit
LKYLDSEGLVCLIKIRSGGKRAIVAIARTLLLRMRRMLLDEQAYALSRAA